MIHFKCAMTNPLLFENYKINSKRFTPSRKGIKGKTRNENIGKAPTTAAQCYISIQLYGNHIQSKV